MALTKTPHESWLTPAGYAYSKWAEEIGESPLYDTLSYDDKLAVLRAATCQGICSPVTRRTISEIGHRLRVLKYT